MTIRKLELNRLKRLFERSVKNDREQFLNRIADDAEAGMAWNDLRAAYRAINVLGGRAQAQLCGVPINDASGVPCKSEEDILQRWAEHYEQALNHPAGSLCRELDDLASDATPDTDIADDAPSLEEVQRAIRKLKNGRAAGCDKIPPELLKCALDPVSKALHGLFCAVWRSGKISAEWKEGIIVSLYKGKGPWNECGSHRPITLLSVPGKVCAHILLARLDPLLQKHRRPHQSGFTRCRSTLDALRLLAEVHREFQQPLLSAFVDLKSAFTQLIELLYGKP